MNAKTTMPARLAFLALALAAASLALASCGSYKKQSDAINAIQVGVVDPASVKDGVYEQAEDYGLDTAKVKVTVKAGRIESIQLLEHRHGPGKKHSGEPVVGRVVEKQSLQVDVVSGATGSSKVILKAIENALRQGM